MNSKTCDVCGKTASGRDELFGWIQVVRPAERSVLRPTVLDACSQQCGVSAVGKMEWPPKRLAELGSFA